MIKNSLDFLDLHTSYSLQRKNIQSTYRICFLLLLILPVLTGSTLSNFMVYAQTNQTDDSMTEGNEEVKPNNNIEQDDSVGYVTTTDSDTASVDQNQVTSTEKQSEISEQVSNPDQDCLFDPSLPKCSPDENGNCPEGFNMNGDGECFPRHDRCPTGYHSHEDDESGRCIPDNIPCDPGYIISPNFPECQDKDSLCPKYPNLDECKVDEDSNSGGTNTDAYNSGYDHGCSDSKISDLSKRYVNQPGKGAEYHTELFMRGYNDGYNQCVDSSIPISIDASTGQVQEVAKGTFKIIVKVTNNEITDEKGGIYLRIDDTDISKKILDVTFPAKTTVTKTFEFNSKDVPVGKEFSAEVIYGDDYDVDAHGINRQTKAPETLHLYLGQPSPVGDTKFIVDVKVTNHGTKEQTGFIDIEIDNTNIYMSKEATFPAKTTVTKTFEFNSNDVPVGKGFTVNLISRDDSIQTEQNKQGVNSQDKSRETLNFVLGSSSKFVLDVRVTNTDSADTYGYLSVKINNPIPTDVSKFSSIDLPAKTTVTKTFEFNSEEVPVGKGFTVNLSYGLDGQIENTGTNSPLKQPEIIEFTIP